LYHKNLSQASHITKIPKIRKNWAGQLVSPGGQHLAAKRCIAETQKMGPRGTSRLAGLQHRQAVSGNFQKRDQSQRESNFHSPLNPE